jgi:hypothetical protein
MAIESSARRHRVCGSACTRACSAVSGVLTSLSCVVAQGRSATQRSGSTAFNRDHMSVGTLLSVCGSTTSQASRKGRPQSLFCESLDVLLYANGTPHTHTHARAHTNARWYSTCCCFFAGTHASFLFSVDPDNGDSGGRDHGSGWWYEGGGLCESKHFLIRASLLGVLL